MRAATQPSTFPRRIGRKALAALDLGTNNCRLLIARPRNDAFEIIDSFSRIVRLGEGIAQSGLLAERAMARTIAALRICARIMARHDAVEARCVATEACRRAGNGSEFLRRVHRATGISLEVIAQDQEVRLALLGCLPLIDPAADHVLLVDIGGGSTEVLWLDRSDRGPGTIRGAVSLPIGVVTLTEAHSAEPDTATYAAMVRDIRVRLAPVEAVYRLRARFADAEVQMIGTSGTVTTLAAMMLGLPRYDRSRIDGLTVETAALQAVTLQLRSMTVAGRTAHPCIGAGRADLVIAGCAILEAILDCWPVQRLRVADRGLREGILHGLMGRSLETSAGIASPDAGPAAGRGGFSAAVPGSGRLAAG
jgi:exopolyphosphatase/guanosine-5'-triphosphate,3'-diphosphate pyrophosphatase